MKTVYMCFAADMIHAGHINIIDRARALGSITAGMLTDEVIVAYDRYTVVPLEDRVRMLGNIKGIDRVIVQHELYYDSVLRELKPDYVVHGDNWKTGVLAGVRARVIEVLAEWGGELVEFPYTHDPSVVALEKSVAARLGIPEVRRPRLRRLLASGKIVKIMEAHDGLSGLIVENTAVEAGDRLKSFDGMWLSSLCDSTMKGKPDIELVDMTSRLQTVDEIMEVTTKPIIFDGDTGGQIEHFAFNIRTLERIGVSAVIIEDKIGLKKNSLFGTEVPQQQDSIESFCEKIHAGKSALLTKEFMLIARIESLILEQGMADALERAAAYAAAGADGIMIHSRRKQPDEIFEFCEKFRQADPTTPLVVVPSTFASVTEEEFAARGVNIVIYANQLLRSAFPAMRTTAEMILKHGRAQEADAGCISIKEVINLIL
ncbi:MAG: phosphoenolpyruvate mutase [Oscillospiraceae bacterium]|nr:phosphoenolpyruvate mutase [Oscillospiraceae bacterium]